MRGSASENVYLAIWIEKILWYKEGHTKRLSGMFLPEKKSFPESLQKPFFLPRLLPHLLCCCTGQEKSAQSVQEQLNTFFNHQYPKERRHHAAMDTFRPGGSDQDLSLLQAFKGIPFLSLHGTNKVAWADDCTILEQFFHCCGHLCRLWVLGPEFSPKSYKFWNTVTLQPWPRISTAFPKHYAHCAKKHLQSISLWYLLYKIKAQGEKIPQFLSAIP